MSNLQPKKPRSDPIPPTRFPDPSHIAPHRLTAGPEVGQHRGLHRARAALQHPEGAVVHGVPSDRIQIDRIDPIDQISRSADPEFGAEQKELRNKRGQNSVGHGVATKKALTEFRGKEG